MRKAVSTYISKGPIHNEHTRTISKIVHINQSFRIIMTDCLETLMLQYPPLPLSGGENNLLDSKHTGGKKFY